VHDPEHNLLERGRWRSAAEAPENRRPRTRGPTPVGPQKDPVGGRVQVAGWENGGEGNGRCAQDSPGHYIQPLRSPFALLICGRC